MDKEDARYQTLEQLHERRKQVIRLHKRGIKVMELVQMSGLSYPAVRKVLDLFEQGGWPAIKPAGRGRTKGDARLLTPEQEAHIKGKTARCGQRTHGHAGEVTRAGDELLSGSPRQICRRLRLHGAGAISPRPVWFCLSLPF